ncbi:MAG: Sua5/YciO/YrdC/YwlC family protein [Gemmatimonadales bacterium]
MLALRLGGSPSPWTPRTTRRPPASGQEAPGGKAIRRDGADFEDARRLASFDEGEAALLAAKERPVVLVKRRSDAVLAPSVAPGLEGIGVMLASTALHHLLLDAVGVLLVMTSGNVTEELTPSAMPKPSTAWGPVADGFPAARPGDPGPVRRLGGAGGGRDHRVPPARPQLRPGTAHPAGTQLPPRCWPSACTSRTRSRWWTGPRAFVSQHIGDLENSKPSSTSAPRWPSTAGSIGWNRVRSPGISIRLPVDASRRRVRC